MTVKIYTKNIVNDAIIKDLSTAVGNLDYGTVTVKVHDRRITQIEVAERKRFDDIWKEEGGGI
ncbi:MAG: YezD family protein [Candidatus Omnitrophica bacterium]|nr:YezD family protein [Candidatus Omnitrophota bacterium]MDD5661146.1 YezD family protein [Candidatus Omnitrophota bacterium]